jgi:hypothetical protein
LAALQRCYQEYLCEKGAKAKSSKPINDVNSVSENSQPKPKAQGAGNPAAGFKSGPKHPPGNKKQKPFASTPQQGKKDKVKCNHCGIKGHLEANCMRKRNEELQAQLDSYRKKGNSNS